MIIKWDARWMDEGVVEFTRDLFSFYSFVVVHTLVGGQRWEVSSLSHIHTITYMMKHLGKH